MTASNIQTRMESNKEKETPIVLCMKTSTPGHFPATVGIEVHCVKCKEMVWLSDSTIQAVKKMYKDDSKECPDCIKLQLPDDQLAVRATHSPRCESHSLDANPPAPHCVECGMEHMTAQKMSGSNLSIMKYTDEQFEEVRAALKKYT